MQRTDRLAAFGNQVCRCRVFSLPIAAALSALLAVGALGTSPVALAASPTLSSIFPRGGQRGTEVRFEFVGQRLEDAEEILYYSSGFETLALEKVEGGKVTARIKIAPDCRLGVHSARVRTRSGITDLKTFFVGALPAAQEKEPNSKFDTPQKLALNSTVAGVITSEDVDYYAFEAKKGQRISLEIEAMRLGNTIFDPYIAILDSARFELAACDDSPLLLQDATCQVVAPADGVYYAQVRESSYGGNDSCHYRLHIGTFPRPLVAYPPGGKKGAEIEVSFLGDVAGAAKKKIRVPENPPRDFALFFEDDDGAAPSGVVFRPSAYDETLEIEPNGDHKTATTGTVPGAFNGIISEPGDRDCFRFAAKKGQTFEVELYARRLRSPLDPVLRVHAFGGGQVTANDDSRGPDSYFRFTAPESKEYVITVGDHLSSGGPDFVYRVEIVPVKPGLSLSIPRVGRYSQERQSIVVPRGNRFATMVSVSRGNFGGDLALLCEDLPAGVKLHCDTVPSNLSAIPVIFEASPDAAVGGAICKLEGAHVDTSKGIRGEFDLNLDLLVGDPGQSIYLTQHVNRLAVGVAEDIPFALEIVEPKVPLVRAGVMALKVRAKRKEGFDAAIPLQMVFNPPGVSSRGGVSIPKGQTEATIQLNASGSAQVRDWQITVLGSSDAGKGTIWAASPFVTLRVAEPYLSIAVDKSSVEQGKNVELFCKVTAAKQFSGKAKVSLQGLPHKVTAPSVEITSETKEFTFPVQVAKDSPAGRHRSVFCRVEILENDEPMVHSTGGTELRIDKPLPPPKPKQAAPAKIAKKVEKPKPKPEPAPKPAKRLTRLEKLRLDYERRKKEENGESSPEN